MRFCEDVRRLRPDVVFGADLIAGFPTETDEMFANSLSVVDDCGLTYLHVFPYSARRGTPAARMPQVARALVKERAARLREKGADALSRFSRRAGRLGGRGSDGARRRRAARGNLLRSVCLAAVEPAGSLLRARVDGHDGTRLSGEVLA